MSEHFNILPLNVRPQPKSTSQNYQAALWSPQEEVKCIAHGGLGLDIAAHILNL